MENVEKGKEAPNWSLFCPKGNGQQSEPEGCPPKGSRVKVRNDQSERIVEILTEYVTKEWNDENKWRKNVNV